MPSARELEKSPFFLGGVALCSWPKSCTTSFITSSVRTTEKVWLAISDFFFHQFHHHPPFRNGSVFKARCHFHDHMVFSGSTAQKNSSAFRAYHLPFRAQHFACASCLAAWLEAFSCAFFYYYSINLSLSSVQHVHEQ